MSISRDENGSLRSTISTDPLPEIEYVWHDVRVDVLSLKMGTRFNSGVYVVQYDGAPAIAKIACFEWDIPRIEHETWAYSVISSHEQQHPNNPPIGPKFLGHLTENNRVIGFLLEKVDGKPAGIEDLANCEALVRRLHSLKFIHGDVNRYNVFVNRPSGVKYGYWISNMSRSTKRTWLERSCSPCLRN
ncbi:alpha-galactosidase A [Penicillium herquei]|nr:alpha-galactosidase A [Penicillium herquei]